MIETEKNIMDLPNEVMEYITNFLTYSDKNNLRQVNKYFYLLTTEKHYIKNEYFNFYKDNCAQNITKILLQTQREFYGFSFYKIDFSEEIIKIFDKFNNITSLELVECNIDEKFLTKILLTCPSLQLLRFDFCKSLFMPGVIFSNCKAIYDQKCINLKSLSFENSSYLSDYILDQFCSVCPNVETLTFAQTPINFHKGLCKRFYNEIYDKPANSVLTFFLIHKIIEKKASKIKNLNFSSTNIDGESLKELCTIPTLKLDSLTLLNCKEIRKSFTLPLGDWQPSLVKLDLKSCPGVNNSVLENIFLKMPNLTYLNLESCKNIDQQGLEGIKNLKKLKVLNISDCPIKYNLASMENNFKNLSLTNFYCQNINIFENELDNFNDVDISLTFLKNVTCLDLSYIRLNNSVLEAIVRNCSNLHSLVLLRCLTITDNFFVDNIGSLRGLKCINLDFCNISDVSLLNSFDFMDLRHCSLNNTKVTSAGINALVKKCPRIETLNLNDCDIDNFCIENIATLKILHSLSLANCRKLEEKSISFIFEKYGSFKNLNISGLRNITQDLIKKISDQNLVRKKFYYSILVASNSYFSRDYRGNPDIDIF